VGATEGRSSPRLRKYGEGQWKSSIAAANSGGLAVVARGRGAATAVLGHRRRGIRSWTKGVAGRNGRGGGCGCSQCPFYRPGRRGEGSGKE
jgi:hypothetical protein